MPKCIYDLQNFANPLLITIQILIVVLFQTRNSLKCKKMIKRKKKLRKFVTRKFEALNTMEAT